MTITDENLSAYLDNELSSVDAVVVRDALAASPELRQRLDLMKRANRNAVAFFSEIDKHPLPETVMETLAAHDSGARTENPAENIVDLQVRPATRSPWSLPLAASIALIVGFGVAQLVSLPQDNDRYAVALQELGTGTIRAANPLFDVLEKTGSGQAVQVADMSGVIAKPILTFRSKSGDYCREYAIESRQSASRNVACRISPDEWHIQTMIALPVENAGNYTVAASTTTRAFDQTIQAMMADIPLGETAETTLIRNKWQPDSD